MRKLSEAKPDPRRIEPAVAKEAIEDAAMEVAMDMAHDFINRYDAQMKKDFADVLNRHAVGDVKWSALDLRGLDEDLYEDQIQDMQMDCATEIVDALVRYAKDYVAMHAEVAASADEDWYQAGKEDEEHFAKTGKERHRGGP